MVLLSRGEGVGSFGWDGFGFEAGCLSEGRFLVLGFLGFGRGGIFLLSFGGDSGYGSGGGDVEFFGSGPRNDN